MSDKQFTQLLQTYPDALTDRRRFAGLLKDFMPGMALQTNLLLNLYDINIHGELEKATLINNVFSYRFAKLLCDDYGVSKRNADWAVETWCTCYGVTVLGKRIETESEVIAPVDKPIKARAETPTTMFDVAANEYVDDWRNTYEYEINDGGVTIKKYIAFDVEKVIIPDTIEGFPVLEIGKESFKNCKGIKQVRLPNSLMRIGNSAFSFSGLTSIQLPQGLIHIGESAFCACKIEYLIIPEGITIISKNAFWMCSSLKDVKLPQHLKTIDRQAFCDCENIRTIAIPEGTKEIGEDAFKGCELLERVRIPNSVMQIGRSGGSILDNTFGQFFSSKVKITIYCNPGSEALKYARAQSIQVDKLENY